MSDILSLEFSIRPFYSSSTKISLVIMRNFLSLLFFSLLYRNLLCIKFPLVMVGLRKIYERITPREQLCPFFPLLAIIPKFPTVFVVFRKYLVRNLDRCLWKFRTEDNKARELFLKLSKLSEEMSRPKLEHH